MNLLRNESKMPYGGRQEFTSYRIENINTFLRLPKCALNYILSHMNPYDLGQYALTDPRLHEHIREISKYYIVAEIHSSRRLDMSHQYWKITTQFWNNSLLSVITDIRIFVIARHDGELLHQECPLNYKEEELVAISYCSDEQEMENSVVKYIDSLFSNALIGRLDITKTYDFLNLSAKHDVIVNARVEKLILHDCEYVNQKKLLQFIGRLSPKSLTMTDKFYEIGSSRCYIEGKRFRPDELFLRDSKIVNLEEFLFCDLGADAPQQSFYSLKAHTMEFNPSPLPPIPTQLVFCKFIQEWKSGRRNISHISFYARLLTHFYDAKVVGNVLNCEFLPTNHGENAALIERKVKGKAQYIAIQVGSWLHAEVVPQKLTQAQLEEL